MTRAIALKKAGDSCQSLGKGHDKGYSLEKKAGDAGHSLGRSNDKGYCLEKKTGDSCQRLGKGDDKGYCLEEGEALPVKALEKAMTKIALKKGKRFMSKPWKRE